MTTVNTPVHYINFSVQDLNPETRCWEYDKAGNRVHKEDGNPVVICDDGPAEEPTLLNEDNMSVQLDWTTDADTITITSTESIATIDADSTFALDDESLPFIEAACKITDPEETDD